MYKCGLVLEGGGSRAIYTSGVLDSFMEENIEFPYVIGVSAGSCNGVSFIGKDYKRQHDIIIKYCNDKRYMSLESMLKTGEYLNGDWIFGELSYDISPLNQDEYDKSSTVMCAVVTNALTGKAEYMYPKDLRERGCKCLRASCSLPGATKGVVIGKDLYFDGGLVDSIPIKRAFDDGCEKAVVILTQDKTYTKQAITHPRLINKIFKKYPNVGKCVLSRHSIYNRQRKQVAEDVESGCAFAIYPSQPLNCLPLEKNTDKLERIYQIGYNDGKKNMAKLKEFLNEK